MPVMSFAGVAEWEFFAGCTMLDRPLVFGNDVPSIMIYHEQINRFHNFFDSLRVKFETSRFSRVLS